MRHPYVAAWVVFALAGCASGPQEVGAPPASEGRFKATGRVAFSGFIANDVDSTATSAAFNDERVVGATVNMSRRADGSWGGTLAGELITIDAAGSAILGAGTNLHVKREGGEFVVGGYLRSAPVRVVIDAEEIRLTHPSRSFELPRLGAGQFGPRGELRLEGLAADPSSAPSLQLALALLGVIQV